MTADGTNRHSTPVVIGTGLAGLAIGAAAAFAITGLVFTVRVELPPPPYPQLSSVPSGGVPAPASSPTQPATPSVAPTSTRFTPLPPPPEPVQPPQPR